MQSRLPILIALVSLAALSCELGPFPKPPPQPEPPSPWDGPADAAPPDDSDADTELDGATHTPCYQACAKLKALSCPEAKPTAAGATCNQVCTNNESGPMATSLDPSCVAKADTCDATRKCMFGW